MPTPDREYVAGFADAIMTMVDEAIAEGAVPANVRGFTDLHSYLDANDFLNDARCPTTAATRALS